MSLRNDIYQIMVRMDEDAIPHDRRVIKVKDLEAFSKAFVEENRDPFSFDPLSGVVKYIYGVPVVEDKELGHMLAMVTTQASAD